MADLKGLIKALNQKGIPLKENEEMRWHTTFKIGGPAALMVCPQNQEQLLAALAFCRQADCRYFLLGNGSNVLFSDAGYPGVVISLGDVNEGVVFDGGCVTASAGTMLVQLARAAQARGLTGLEFAYGIPGTLGGAIYMNAGAYGSEIKGILKRVAFVSAKGEVCQCEAIEELALGYRSSIFQTNGACILSATLQLQPGEPEAIQAQMEDYMRRRRAKQPLEYPSAGSTFKRPMGAYAGTLIDQCGLKGLRVGDAQISEKHAGFVINRGHATCQDVLALCEQVKTLVQQKTGYVLEKEIRVVE